MPVDEIDVALDHFLEEGRNMGKVVVQASMSLDGFVADTNDQVGPLFDWYGNGRRGCCSKTQTSFKAIE